MKITTDIARRYIFGKKSTNAINWITWVVIVGVSIGSATMIISMSVFNGFEQILSSLFNAYNPDYKVYPAKGLYLEADSAQIAELESLPEVIKVARSLEEVAFFEYDGSQEAGYIKGVDDAFTEVTDIDSTLIRGTFELTGPDADYGVLGIGMYNKLSVNSADAFTPITVYMPKKKKRGPLDKDYTTQSLYPKGIFSIGNEDDSQYIISSYEFVNDLLGTNNAISYLEIKTKDNLDEDALREKITNILGANTNIKNRYQQDEAYLKIMNIEKWVAFLLVALTILILSFNLVGSLWMIVLDKKKDLSILRSMGMTSQSISSLVLKLGMMISSVGLLFGILFAVGFYILQKEFGIISVPPGFMIDAYPIALKWTDFVVTIITVLFIAFIASVLPAIKAKKVGAFVRYE